MVCHIVIDRRVDGPGPQTVGKGKKEQHPVAAANREAQQTEDGHQDGDNDDPLRMESSDQPRTHQSGEDCHKGDRHGDISGPG